MMQSHCQWNWLGHTRSSGNGLLWTRLNVLSHLSQRKWTLDICSSNVLDSCMFFWDVRSLCRLAAVNHQHCKKLQDTLVPGWNLQLMRHICLCSMALIQSRKIWCPESEKLYFLHIVRAELFKKNSDILFTAKAYNGRVLLEWLAFEVHLASMHEGADTFDARFPLISAALTLNCQPATCRVLRSRSSKKKKHWSVRCLSYFVDLLTDAVAIKTPWP